jgi:hypothetical protein
MNTNTSITWGTSIETLGFLFLQKVLSNMATDSSVRFGQTGKGIRPNYQVTYANGEIAVFRGTHETFQDIDKFNRDNISIAFSYEDVLLAMKNAEKLNQAELIGE